jgi:Flp pilus assembly protein TadG
MSRLWRRLRKSERGTAVVEFALIAPVLFVLVIGVMDFSRALNYYNDLTQLAGQGARAAAINRNPDETAIGSAPAPCNSASTHSIQCELANIYTTTPELRGGVTACIPSVPAAGQPVTVHMTYTFKFLVLPLGLHLGRVTLSASSTQLFNQLTPGFTAGDQTGATCT